MAPFPLFFVYLQSTLCIRYMLKMKQHECEGPVCPRSSSRIKHGAKLFRRHFASSASPSPLVCFSNSWERSGGQAANSFPPSAFLNIQPSSFLFSFSPFSTFPLLSSPLFPSPGLLDPSFTKHKKLFGTVLGTILAQTTLCLAKTNLRVLFRQFPSTPPPPEIY